MKRRVDLICAVYMALILCLIGVGGFLLYQQEQVIKKQSQYATKLLNREPEVAEVVFVQLPPEIVVETIYVDKLVDRIVERFIVEEKEVEVIIYRYLPICNWESIEEFEVWYAEQNFAPVIFNVGADCDDFSRQLQREAARQGYLVSEAIAKNRLYAGCKVTKAGGLHAGNLVMIDGVYYWVEPQPEKFYTKRIFDRD